MATDHHKKLQTFCRVCGYKLKKLKRRGGFAKVCDYRREILNVFDIDVTCDHPNIHPQYVCLTDEALLRKSKRTKIKLCKNPSAEQSVVFTQCSRDENCHICNNKLTRPRRRPPLGKYSSLSTDNENLEQQLSVNDLVSEVTPIPLEDEDDEKLERSEADVIIDHEGFEADGFYVEYCGKIYQYDPSIISADDFKNLLSKQENGRIFKKLTVELADVGTLTLHGWNTTISTDAIYLTQFSYCDKIPVISKSVTIDSDLSVTISVHNQQLLPDHPIFKECSIKSKQHVLRILSELGKFNVCCGNFDEDFQDFVPRGVGLSRSDKKAITAFREGNFLATSADGVKYESTIRSVDCQLLINGTRCHACSQYRGTLRCMRSRGRKSALTDRIGPQSRVPYTALSKEELCQKLRNTKAQLIGLQVTNEHIKKHLKARINDQGIALNSNTSSNVAPMMKDSTSYVMSNYKPDTFVET